MANFNTHLMGGAVISGFGASALAYTTLYNLNQAAVLWVAGTLAGLLPDIDADSSAPLSWIFSLLGFVASLFVLQMLVGQSLLVIWGAMLCVFLAVRYGVMTLFTRMTRHRGAYHSCLAGVFTALTVAWMSWRYVGLSADFSWGLGGMTLLGFLTHLVLDECYSVNISGVRIKKSFGTALKLFSIRAWWASAVFAAGSVWLWRNLPPSDTVIDAVTALILHKANWQLVWLSCL
jgi:hypothetical protein